MRYTNRLSVVTVALAAAGLAAVVVAAFVVVSLVTGGGGDDEAGDIVQAVETIEPPPTTSLDATPGPPRGPVPTHDPDLPGGFTTPTQRPTPKGPASVTISGVVIPIPEGWHYTRTGGGEVRPGHIIWKGDSSSEQTDSGPIPLGVRFDDFGLTYVKVASSEEPEVEATLDALWTLAQMAGTLSPPSVTMKGVDIPFPEGSYYTVFDTPQLPKSPATYFVRLEHSLLVFDGWGPNPRSVRPGDEARFQATLDALEELRTVALGERK